METQDLQKHFHLAEGVSRRIIFSEGIGLQLLRYMPSTSESKAHIHFVHSMLQLSFVPLVVSRIGAHKNVLKCRVPLGS